MMKRRLRNPTSSKPKGMGGSGLPARMSKPKGMGGSGLPARGGGLFGRGSKPKGMGGSGLPARGGGLFGRGSKPKGMDGSGLPARGGGLFGRGSKPKGMGGSGLPARGGGLFGRGSKSMGNKPMTRPGLFGRGSKSMGNKPMTRPGLFGRSKPMTRPGLFGRSKPMGNKPSGGLFGGLGGSMKKNNAFRVYDNPTYNSSPSGIMQRSNSAKQSSPWMKTLFGKKQANALNSFKPMSNVKPSQQPPINTIQQQVKQRLSMVQQALPGMEQAYNQWKSSQSCDGFMKRPDVAFVSRLTKFVQTLKGAYGGRITIFDYDAYVHSITSRALRVLSLMYSSFSFYSNEDRIERELKLLIKRLHSLFVLATCDTYFGKEVRMYVAARESGNATALASAKATIQQLTPKLRSVFSPFIDRSVIRRFST